MIGTRSRSGQYSVVDDDQLGDPLVPEAEVEAQNQRVRPSARQLQTTKLRERAGLRPGIPERATASIFQLVTMFAAIRRASSRGRQKGKSPMQPPPMSAIS